VLFASLRYNLANLLSFSGRESRALFWPYAIAIVVLDFVGMFVLMAPAMSESVGRMQRFAAAHPDQATVESGPGHYSISIHGNHPELMPDMSFLFAGVAVIALATVVLVGAAVARRLHDRGRRGWWGMMPLPFLCFALVMEPRMFASFGSGHAPDIGLFMAMFLNNLLYLASLVVLVILLVGEGTKGPNRFGAQAA
jgi:uncharacterized membrane protein YhaH (DUF805 family)